MVFSIRQYSELPTLKLRLYDATLVDFDSNTLLAMGLWNYTNNSNNIIISDNISSSNVYVIK